MKKGFLLPLLAIATGALAFWNFDVSSKSKEINNKSSFPSISLQLQDGDIIFQSSTSGQSLAIQLATHSKYSHVGIIYEVNHEYFVYEAVQPVKITPLNVWISRGDNNHYVVKRLKNATEVLTPDVVNAMKKAGKKYNGKNYDLYFEWSDERIYCSELVWKIYKEGAGIEIGNLQKLSDFDLTSTEVQSKLKERYGNNIPKNELVVSPEAIFNSKLLTEVVSN